MKHSIKNCFHQPEKLLPLLGIEKIEENWFTPNFKHWKFVSTSQNEGFLEKCDFTEQKSYFHLSHYLKKKKKTVSSTVAEIRFF